VAFEQVADQAGELSTWPRTITAEEIIESVFPAVRESLLCLGPALSSFAIEKRDKHGFDKQAESCPRAAHTSHHPCARRHEANVPAKPRVPGYGGDVNQTGPGKRRSLRLRSAAIPRFSRISISVCHAMYQGLRSLFARCGRWSPLAQDIAQKCHAVAQSSRFRSAGERVANRRRSG